MTTTRAEAEAARDAPTHLLHNMSMRPSTPLRHDGRSACRRLAVAVPHLTGDEAPPDPADAHAQAARWCRALGLPPGDDDAATLRDALEQAVLSAQLPVVVPVVCQARELTSARWSVPAEPPPGGAPAARVAGPARGAGSRHVQRLEALGVALAVVAKSSRKVFLARKEPVLWNLTPGRGVILALPPDWRLP